MMLGYEGVMISDTIAGNLLHVPNEENCSNECLQPPVLKGIAFAWGHLGRLGVANPLTEQ
jgi:hypothetical protein